MSSISVFCVSESRCSNASAAVSSSSCPTTAAASRADRSLMISASSEGCSRANFLLHREAHLGGIGLANRRDRTPRDHRPGTAVDARRESATERFEAETAQQPGDADVGRHDAHAAPGAGYLDVVDAHDFAAIDVDDLLVEQIGDEVECLIVARRRLCGRHRQRDGTVAVDVGDGVDRRKTQSARRLDDEPVDLRKRVVGFGHEEIGDFADREVVDRRAPPTSSEMNPSLNAIVVASFAPKRKTPKGPVPARPMRLAMRRPDPLETALAVALEAGAVLAREATRPREIHEKGRRADLSPMPTAHSERLVLERLRHDYPNATILTEESGTHAGSGDERWIVDPLDGNDELRTRVSAVSASRLLRARRPTRCRRDLCACNGRAFRRPAGIGCAARTIADPRVLRCARRRRHGLHRVPSVRLRAQCGALSGRFKRCAGGAPGRFRRARSRLRRLRTIRRFLGVRLTFVGRRRRHAHHYGIRRHGDARQRIAPIARCPFDSRNQRPDSRRVRRRTRSGRVVGTRLLGMIAKVVEQVPARFRAARSVEKRLGERGCRR